MTLAALGNAVGLGLGLIYIVVALDEGDQGEFDAFGLIVRMAVMALLLVPVLNFCGIIARLLHARSCRTGNRRETDCS